MTNADIRNIIELAYVAGFMRSGEGYNGEYPFDYDEGAICREIADHDTINGLVETIANKLLAEERE